MLKENIPFNFQACNKVGMVIFNQTSTQTIDRGV